MTEKAAKLWANEVQKGTGLDTPGQRLAEQVVKLEEENRILRGLVQTNPDWKCPHGVNVPNIALCPFGFPGCACADDRIAVLCEDGGRLGY